MYDREAINPLDKFESLRQWREMLERSREMFERSKTTEENVAMVVELPYFNLLHADNGSVN